MLQLAEKVDGSVLWANLHLLFWLSLLPFTTGWIGENHIALWPTTLYGANLLLCALAYSILQARLIEAQGVDHRLAKAVSGDFKDKISPVLYILGVVAAWLVMPAVGTAFFVVTAMIWLVPDRRIERVIAAR